VPWLPRCDIDWYRAVTGRYDSWWDASFAPDEDLTCEFDDDGRPTRLQRPERDGTNEYLTIDYHENGTAAQVRMTYQSANGGRETPEWRFDEQGQLIHSMTGGNEVEAHTYTPPCDYPYINCTSICDGCD
jgi:hypothetical protein